MYSTNNEILMCILEKYKLCKGFLLNYCTKVLKYGFYDISLKNAKYVPRIFIGVLYYNTGTCTQF